MTENPVVNCEIADRIATVTLNRPKALNALDRQLIRELTSQIDRLARDPHVAAIVITGAGEKSFVAGADIAAMRDLTPMQARDFAREGQAFGAAFDRAGKPVIAAINGFALGGGCELAMACHLRLAARRAKFGQPEVGLGLIPGFGGTQRLARLVGEGRALELVLSGRMIDAETALAWGLINGIAEQDVVAEARALASEIASKAPVAVRLSLEAVRQGLQMPLEEALEYEAALFGVTFGTEDRLEGINAFLDKRKAAFRGR